MLHRLIIREQQYYRGVVITQLKLWQWRNHMSGIGRAISMHLCSCNLDVNGFVNGNLREKSPLEQGGKPEDRPFSITGIPSWSTCALKEPFIPLTSPTTALGGYGQDLQQGLATRFSRGPIFVEGEVVGPEHCKLSTTKPQNSYYLITLRHYHVYFFIHGNTWE